MKFIYKVKWKSQGCHCHTGWLTLKSKNCRAGFYSCIWAFIFRHVKVHLQKAKKELYEGSHKQLYNEKYSPVPSGPGGQMGSQDDGPSAGSHRTGSDVPLHKPDPAFSLAGVRKAHQFCLSAS